MSSVTHKGHSYSNINYEGVPMRLSATLFSSSGESEKQVDSNDFWGLSFLRFLGITILARAMFANRLHKWCLLYEESTCRASLVSFFKRRRFWCFPASGCFVVWEKGVSIPVSVVLHRSWKCQRPHHALRPLVVSYRGDLAL